MDCTVTAEPTSPQFSPPIPSARIAAFRESTTSQASSLFVRLRPVSVAPNHFTADLLGVAGTRLSGLAARLRGRHERCATDPPKLRRLESVVTQQFLLWASLASAR